jgi:NitT/TauT family transport system ATP-binding protein
MGVDPLQQPMGMAMEARRPKICLRDIDVRFGALQVLHGLSLDVREGEVFAIIGQSGCGKSTLLNVIAGFVVPNAGVVTVDDQPVVGPGPDRVMVFQEDAVFPWATVRRNVEYALRLRGVKSEIRQQRGDSILDLVSLTDHAEFWPRQLSGGMKKRVDLARALAADPEVVLMDEPYAALDQFTKERLQHQFLQIMHAEKISTQATMTAVFVTHDIEEAIYVGDRIGIMTNGAVSEIVDGPLPHPRTLDMKLAPEIQALRRDLVGRLR